MIDIKKVIQDSELAQKNCDDRNVNLNIQEIIGLYERQKSLKIELDNLRNQKNQNINLFKTATPEEREDLKADAKRIKTEIGKCEAEYKEVIEQYQEDVLKIPNYSHDSVPIGGEEDSITLKEVNDIPKFDFEVKDHVELGTKLDILDFKTAAEVSGAKFYYLKNEGVLLELALTRYVLDKIMDKGFIPHITPDLAKESVVSGIGYNPRGNETNIYSIEGGDLCLIGTSEITLGGMYMNKLLKSKEMPLRLAGLSHCFRTEAGSAGRASKGLYRVHQFSKVEMFIICEPSESEKYLESILEIEEDICKELNLPYRVLDIASGDLGNPASRKYDIEVWMPGRNSYGEVTSASNCTDYQSRRLNIKYKDSANDSQFVHMLNGTAIAIPRMIIAILENFQNEDGTVDIPPALHDYLKFTKIEHK
jgi:seryl-tRNA synthetase